MFFPHIVHYRHPERALIIDLYYTSVDLFTQTIPREAVSAIPVLRVVSANTTAQLSVDVVSIHAVHGLLRLGRGILVWTKEGGRYS